MLGKTQKECIADGLRKSICMIKIGKIDDPDEIQFIVDTALARRRDKTISDYKEIGTNASELLSFLHEAFPDEEGQL